MTTVGILGMIHDEEWQRIYHYPLSLAEELIVEFNPDVICGEVHPDSWSLYRGGGDPRGIYEETQPEYPALIFPLSEEKGIEFIPVNWFEFDVFKGRFDSFPQTKKEELETELSRWTARQLETWDSGSIPVNSLDYDRITREKYEWLHSVSPDVEDINWNARHFIMLQRVKNAIQAHEGKRILCVHGADHNYWYHSALQKVPQVQVVYPLR